MTVRALTSLKMQGKTYLKGEVFEISESLFEKIQKFVEPVTEEEALEYKIRTVNLPIYIREYCYLDKKISDTLIISREQLRRCLRDRNYGEVFQAFLGNETCKTR